MGIGAVFAIAGGLQVAGNFLGNRAQAKAERANAAYYREQAELTKREKRRAVDIYKTQSDQFIGQKKSIIARSGVDLGGTLLMQIAGDVASQGREIEAINAEMDAKVRLAHLRAQQADKTANTLSSFGYNVLQAAGSGLNTYASYMSLSKQAPSPRVSSLNSTSGITPDGGYSGPILDSRGNFVSTRTGF
jgi:hypothetical protein